MTENIPEVGDTLNLRPSSFTSLTPFAAQIATAVLEGDLGDRLTNRSGPILSIGTTNKEFVHIRVLNGEGKAVWVMLDTKKKTVIGYSERAADPSYEILKATK